MNKLLIMLKLKSKTVNVMALYAAVIALLGALGININQEVVAALGTIIAMVMRSVTKGSLEDKVNG